MKKPRIFEFLRNRQYKKSKQNTDNLNQNKELQEKHKQLLKERGIESRSNLKQISTEDLTKIRKIINFWAKSKGNNKKEMIELLMSLDRGLKRKLQRTEDLDDGLIISPILAYGFGEMFSYSIKENLTKKENRKKEIIDSTILAKKLFTDDIEVTKFSSSFLKYPKSVRVKVYSDLERIFSENILKPYNEYLRTHSRNINLIIADNSLKVHTDRLKHIKDFLLIEDNAPKW